MSLSRRMDKLEGALSPRSATLLWLAEAHEFGSLPAYTDWLIDQPPSAAPLERVPRAAEAAAMVATKGQPPEIVHEAARKAVRGPVYERLCSNRPTSGLPWVSWSLVVGFQATVAVLCRVSNSTGVSMPNAE